MRTIQTPHATAVVVAACLTHNCTKLDQWGSCYSNTVPFLAHFLLHCSFVSLQVTVLRVQAAYISSWNLFQLHCMSVMSVTNEPLWVHVYSFGCLLWHECQSMQFPVPVPVPAPVCIFCCQCMESLTRKWVASIRKSQVTARMPNTNQAQCQ